jgi:hypothetical protein
VQYPTKIEKWVEGIEIEGGVLIEGGNYHRGKEGF